MPKKQTFSSDYGSADSDSNSSNDSDSDLEQGNDLQVGSDEDDDDFTSHNKGGGRRKGGGQGKRTRKDDDLYGVFMDSDSNDESDDDDSHAGSKRKRNTNSKSEPYSSSASSSSASRRPQKTRQSNSKPPPSKILKPLSFVSASEPSTSPPPSPDNSLELKKQAKEAQDTFLELLKKGTKAEDDPSHLPQPSSQQLQQAPAVKAGLGLRAGLGLGFSKSISHESQQPQQQQQHNEYEEEYDQPSNSFGGLGSFSSASGLGFGGLSSSNSNSSSSSFGGVGYGSNPPPRLDPNLGSFETHTKGIGLKLLKKFGFTGRLGSKSNGVSSNLEVVVRPGGLGLGFGGFKEATKLKGNVQFEKELRGDASKEGDKRGGKIEVKDNGGMKELESLVGEGWRKSTASKSVKTKKIKIEEKREYITTETSSATTVIDMRGPSVKVLSSINDASATGSYSSVSSYTATGPPKIGTELLHNLSLIISNAEMEVQTSSHFHTAAKEKTASLQREEKVLDERITLNKAKKKSIESIKTKIEELEMLLLKGAPQLNEIVEVFASLQRLHPVEYDSLRLYLLIPNFMEPVIKSELADWDVLGDPTFAYRLLNEVSSGLSSSSISPISSSSSSSSQYYLTSLFESTISPIITRTLLETWSVHHPTPMITLYSSFLSVLPSPAPLATLINTVILPRLSRAITTWDPKVATIGIHAWIQPWLPYLPNSALSSLFPVIRRKFHDALKQWHPSDTSAYKMISPWKGVFDSKSFSTLISRSILPKLVDCLKTEVVLIIDPVDVERSSVQFKWIEIWKDVLDGDAFVTLIEGEFMLNWLTVLWTMASSTTAVDKKQLASFYMFWRGLLTANSLINDDQTCLYLHIGLCIIKAAVSGDVDKVTIFKPPNRLSHSYEKAKIRRDDEALVKIKENQRANSSYSGYSRGVTSSFREVCESRFADLGITVIPRNSTTEDGKQLYDCGGLSIFYDGSVIFLKEMGDYKHVSLEEVIRRVDVIARG